MAAQHQDLAAIRGVEPLADLYRGGFARPVGAEKAKALARVNLQVEAVHRYHILIGLVETANLKRRALLLRSHGGNITRTSNPRATGRW